MDFGGLYFMMLSFWHINRSLTTWPRSHLPAVAIPENQLPGHLFVQPYLVCLVCCSVQYDLILIIVYPHERDIHSVRIGLSHVRPKYELFASFHLLFLVMPSTKMTTIKVLKFKYNCVIS